MVPSTSVSVITRHTTSVMGATITTRADGIAAVYIPSTTVASGGVASALGATVSALRRGVDSSTAADGSSSIAAASGSSPS
jgi:hypothetical protein